MIDRYTKVSLTMIAVASILLLTSCSDSGTSTGVAPLSRDAAETGAINNAALKKEDNGEHSDTDPGHSHSPDQQHGEPGNVVTTTTVLALAAIPASRCGNLIQEAGEQCDAGLSGSATCTTNCTLKEGRGGEIVAENFCGDGTKDAGEQCDDGNSNNADSCTQYCKLAVCGDGYTQSANGEQCDDKNKVDTDACSNKCQRQESTAVVTTTVSTVDNTGGGTDIVLTNTVNDKTADVVKDTGASGTITQQAALSGGSNDTPMVEATPSDKPKEGDAQTDGHISLPRDCEAEKDENLAACIDEYDDSPRCVSTYWKSDMFWYEDDAKAACVAVAAEDDMRRVEGGDVGVRPYYAPWMCIDDRGEWTYPPTATCYKCEMVVMECTRETHNGQCSNEVNDKYEQCLAEFAEDVGKP